MWCPSRATTLNEQAITAAYPGTGWVDWLGVDGYNFGEFDGHTGWQTMEEVFTRTLTPRTGLYARLAPRLPVQISEVGCAPGPGKAAWIRHLWGALPATYPTVKAVCWMQNDHPESGRDNRFQETQATWDAFRTGVALSWYQPS